MAHLDPKSGEVVMRVVYDGAPEAGKTTNVHSLTSQVGMARRGAVESPGSRGRRTEFFDWTDFAGGYVDGKRVRCQLVSVPGQPELLHRRRYLLETADVVVYVADSRAELLPQTRDSLARTRQALGRLGHTTPVGLVVQANKQDLTGSLAAEALARELELPEDVAILPARAHVGEGVLRTFTFAASLATERVRAVLTKPSDLERGVVHDNPAELYRAMLHLEDAQPSAPATPTSPVVTQVLPVGVEDWALDVFPPVRGRGLLSRADVGSAVASPEPRAWAPSEAIELRTASGFTLHTAERWSSPSAEAARLQLLELVRAQRAWAELAFPGRALFVVPDVDPERHRVWSVTAPVTSLSQWLEQRLSRRDADAIHVGCQLLQAFEARALELARNVRWPALAVVEGRLATLAIDDAAAPRSEPGQLLKALELFAQSQAARDPELGAWLAARPSLLKG